MLLQSADCPIAMSVCPSVSHSYRLSRND